MTKNTAESWLHDLLLQAAEAADYKAEDLADRASFEWKTDGDEGEEFKQAADDASELAANLRAAAEFQWVRSTAGEDS